MGFATAGRSEAIPGFDVELECGAVLAGEMLTDALAAIILPAPTFSPVSSVI